MIYSKWDVYSWWILVLETLNILPRTLLDTYDVLVGVSTRRPYLSLIRSSTCCSVNSFIYKNELQYANITYLSDLKHSEGKAFR